MIYLIDDNRSNQLESYGCSFIKEGVYANHLVYMPGIPTPDRADFLEELPDKATAVLFHATSKDLDKDGNYLESDETIKKIAKTAKSNNIPFVSFSWGHTSHEAIFDNNNIEAVNKRIFYIHFRDFIELYVEKDFLDFQILAKGIGYKKDALIQQAQNLISDIEKATDPTEHASETSAFAIPVDEFLNASCSENTFHSLLLKYPNKLTYYQLTSILRRSIKSIRKYGYNLYY